MSVRLDERLSAAAAMVRSGKSVCDVGTDHALLPCFLWERGERRLFACDINDGPLEAARLTVARNNAEVTLIKSDGLKNVPPCDDVVIAGMGGELIARIIRECPFTTPDTRFILQPMTKPEILRRELYRSGFEIISETCASAGGKIYTVMLVRFTGKKCEIEDSFAFFGKNSAAAYIKSVNARLEKLANSDRKYLDLIRHIGVEK